MGLRQRVLNRQGAVGHSGLLLRMLSFLLIICACMEFSALVRVLCFLSSCLSVSLSLRLSVRFSVCLVLWLPIFAHNDANMCRAVFCFFFQFVCVSLHEDALHQYR